MVAPVQLLPPGAGAYNARPALKSPAAMQRETPLPIPAAYAFVVLVWSTTPLAIQWSSTTMSPITSVTIRMLASLVIIMAVARQFGIYELRLAQNWRLYLSSALGICPAMPLVYLGAQHIPSGLVSVLFGLSPFLVGLLSGAIANDHSMTKGRYLALLVALAGLATIFLQGDELGPNAPLGITLLLGAVCCFSMSSLFVKRYAANVEPVRQLWGSLSFASLMLVVIWLVFDRSTPQAFTYQSGISLAYLAVVGSVFGFLGYFYLIQRISVNLVSLIPLVTPALALYLGFVLNGEQLSLRIVAGSGLILLGLGLFNYFRPRRVRRG